MKSTFSIVGWLAILILPCYFVFLYGRQWTFGPYGLPASAVAEDGRHYADGTEIPYLSLELLKSGYEPVFSLVIFGIIGASAAYIGWFTFIGNPRLQRELALLQAQVLATRAERRRNAASGDIKPPQLSCRNCKRNLPPGRI